MLLTNQLGKIRSNPDKTKTKCFMLQPPGIRDQDLWKSCVEDEASVLHMLNKCRAHPGPLHLPPRGGSQS